MKKIIRHESQTDFFARMNSLAHQLDRGESVDACESISFEDADEMKTYQSEQHRQKVKASLSVIQGGGGEKQKTKGALKLDSKDFKFRSLEFLDASVFERVAMQVLKDYTFASARLRGGLIVKVSRVEAEKTQPKSRQK
ncbi:hypothetical protein FIV41_32070 [Pseudomonas marginalis]|uniref:Uncharacterized protein n=1 Tax=Pseudomonas marginalis TaxID=298 RepID=A0A9X9FUD7_PSEMA|nr:MULTISPECIES: hypothetical protein [Pseudomonas]ETK24313.1 hypothetical protein H096_06097 [Pseudomonas sp. FH1]QHF43101.1 hypothetical protein PspS35_04625 [Pseudomonas sp. S35]TWR48101.1 hypothetical protein FIV41_32070 [Pseudomonas marginalis]SEB33072.1 hypothetical protein SAMN04490193_0229 [Pseudomonas marginalis]